MMIKSRCKLQINFNINFSIEIKCRAFFRLHSHSTAISSFQSCRFIRRTKMQVVKKIHSFKLVLIRLCVFYLVVCAPKSSSILVLTRNGSGVHNAPSVKYMKRVPILLGDTQPYKICSFEP